MPAWYMRNGSTETEMLSFITGCTGSCHFDNFRCSMWWKFRQMVTFPFQWVYLLIAGSLENHFLIVKRLVMFPSRIAITGHSTCHELQHSYSCHVNSSICGRKIMVDPRAYGKYYEASCLHSRRTYRCIEMASQWLCQTITEWVNRDWLMIMKYAGLMLPIPNLPERTCGSQNQ